MTVIPPLALLTEGRTIPVPAIATLVAVTAVPAAAAGSPAVMAVAPPAVIAAVAAAPAVMVIAVATVIALVPAATVFMVTAAGPAVLTCDPPIEVIVIAVTTVSMVGMPGTGA